MKFAVVPVLILAGLAAMFAQTGQGQAPKLVSVQITTAQVTESTDLRADVLLVWNRDIRSTPIGHSVMSCVKVNSGGLAGSDLKNCSMSVVLPLGKVIATGIVHSYNRFTLVITGGTRAYEGAHGSLVVTRHAGVRRLVFSV